MNSLVGDVVSRAGVAAADDARSGAGVPSLGRALVLRRPDPPRHPAGDRRRRPGRRREPARRPAPGVPSGLALLDAPDVDSVVTENRTLAAQLLAAADLWIFCTTAARYADAVPWDLLHTAQQRSTALAVVLDRVPPEGAREISAHLAAMLDENGLGRATLFAVPETTLDGEAGLLPESSVRPMREWLRRLAADADARAEVIRTTLEGALSSLRQRVASVAREVDDQLATAALLRDEADAAYTDAALEVDDGVRSGSVLRGEVLARWQEFVGTGEITRGLEERIGRLRDRVTAFVLGREQPTAPVGQALESSVEALVRAAADGAAERTVDAWRVRAAGRALLGDRPRALAHVSDDFRPALEREIRAWQGRVLAARGRRGPRAADRGPARLVRHERRRARAHARRLRADRRPQRRRAAGRRRDDGGEPQGARGRLRRQRGAGARGDRACRPADLSGGPAGDGRARFTAS